MASNSEIHLPSLQGAGIKGLHHCCPATTTTTTKLQPLKGGGVKNVEKLT
jgi:hypothetical protein